eukprot:scaffold155653_cov39-Prasinocladus_malaysianus.AAC.1
MAQREVSPCQDNTANKSHCHGSAMLLTAAIIVTIIIILIDLHPRSYEHYCRLLIAVVNEATIISDILVIIIADVAIDVIAMIT